MKKPIVVCFAVKWRLKVDIQSSWPCGREQQAFGKQQLVFSAANYTGAVVKALKWEVTELGISK